MTFSKVKTLIALTAIGGLLLVGGQAFAGPGIDVVPAATLLLPYFEVGLEDSGVTTTTLFSVNNASAAPQIAHVTFWTELSQPTLDFDLYLTGYDVHTYNLRDIFTTGFLNPTPVPISPITKLPTGGNLSIKGVPLPASCIGRFPLGNLPGTASTGLLGWVRASHTGVATPAGFGSLSGKCFSNAQGITAAAEGVAKGYITIDVVTECGTEAPSSAGYFDTFSDPDDIGNVLWGDVFFMDVSGALAKGDPLVHIEVPWSRKDAPIHNAEGFGDWTFYRRYVGFSGADGRESLATTWGVRYFQGGGVAFDDDSQIICWREGPAGGLPLTVPLAPPWTCGGAAPKLAQNQIVIFDEDENAVGVTSSPFSPPGVGPSVNPCPYETQKVPASNFGPIFQYGWMYLNLNSDITGIAGSAFEPAEGSLQSHVAVQHSSQGLFSVGYQAVAFDNLMWDWKNLCLANDGVVEWLPTGGCKPISN